MNVARRKWRSEIWKFYIDESLLKEFLTIYFQKLFWLTFLIFSAFFNLKQKIKKMGSLKKLINKFELFFYFSPFIVLIQQKHTGYTKSIAVNA